MALKKRIKSLEDVAENLRTLYTKKGDDFILDTEADPDEVDTKKKLNEFRDNNRQLMATVEELKAKVDKFKDIDPEQVEEAKKALESVQDEQERQLVKEGRINELVARRMGTAQKKWEQERSDLTARVKALEGENQDVGSRYANVLIDSRVNEMISNVGQLKKGALSDVKNRAKAVWKPDGKGGLTAEGLYNAQGEPMTLEEWGKSLLSEAPYLFEPGGGSGAGGGRSKRQEKESAKVIDASDAYEFGKNLEGIASGRVKAINRSLGEFADTDNGENE